jgi:hypothetical protein
METSNSSSSFPVKSWNKSGTEQPLSTIQLSTLENGISELILDYGHAVGGIPFFETANVQSGSGTVTLEVIYSETRAGIDKEKGLFITSQCGIASDFRQAMDHFFYFRTQWTRTESIRTHSHNLKASNTSSQDSHKSPNGSRKSFSNHQTPPSHFPPSVSDTNEHQLFPRAPLNVQMSC